MSKSLEINFYTKIPERMACLRLIGITGYRAFLTSSETSIEFCYIYFWMPTLYAIIENLFSLNFYLVTIYKYNYNPLLMQFCRVIW